MKFYQQGATVRTQTTVEDSSSLPDPILVDVPVFQVGTVAYGEQVQNGAIEADVLTVLNVNAANRTITVINQTGHNIVLGSNSRLIRRNSPATVFADPIGAVPAGTSKAADGDGWVECYLRDYRYDITVPDILLRTVYADAMGSWVMR